MTAAGLGLALPTPVGPMQPERVLGMIAQEIASKRRTSGTVRGIRLRSAPLWHRSEQPPRVTSRKAWASKQSVICRYHPAQRRTSY